MKDRSYFEHAARLKNRAETSMDVIEFDPAPVPGPTVVDGIKVVEHDLTRKTFRTHVVAWRQRVAAIASGMAR